MKRGSYTTAVTFIALNDAPGDVDDETLSGYLTVALVSEVFAVPQAIVAADVNAIRARADHGNATSKDWVMPRLQGPKHVLGRRGGFQP